MRATAELDALGTRVAITTIAAQDAIRSSRPGANPVRRVQGAGLEYAVHKSGYMEDNVRSGRATSVDAVLGSLGPAGLRRAPSRYGRWLVPPQRVAGRGASTHRVKAQAAA